MKSNWLSLVIQSNHHCMTVTLLKLEIWGSHISVVENASLL